MASKISVPQSFGRCSETERILKYAYKLASEEACKKAKQNNIYDQKARFAKLEVNDRVIVKQVNFDGKHKLEKNKHKNSQAYIIIGIPNLNIPVYRVQTEDGNVGRKLYLGIYYYKTISF